MHLRALDTANAINNMNAMNAMNVNDDFSQRIVIHGQEIPWEDSPMAGVQRRRLDRVVSKQDRVTTIVRFAEGSAFSFHEHVGGEELLVLDGVFEDDYGSWPAGSYIRNPPRSMHTSSSDVGCVLFVKSCQFVPCDRTVIHANIDKLDYLTPQGRSGVSMASLYHHEQESVRVEKWAPGSSVEFTATGGAEVFVIKGSAVEGNNQLEPQSWLRVPVGEPVSATAGPQGALVWIKINHLADM